MNHSPDPQRAQAEILIVDDEAPVRESLRLVLTRNFRVRAADGGDAAIAACDEQLPDLVLLDVMMPGRDGIEVLATLRERFSELPIVMLTADTNIKTVVEAMRGGAEDYVAKPFEINELKLVIDRALERRDLRAEVTRLRSELAGRFHFDRLIGRSKQMRNIYSTIAQVADRRSTVLICGESGTGKELVARAIHYTGERKHRPFIVVNCAAIPETLLDSQLFGHVRGAFTDAHENRTGQFEAAERGTIFLDEIGEMPLAMQAKLLRVLQEREILPVGATHPIRVDVRIIAATNKDLEQAVQLREFRADLFYRLNVVPLTVPPLRDRRDDVPSLVEHFLGEMLEEGRSLRLSSAALEALAAYDWPGNVRELENVIQRLIALAPTSEVQVEHLPSSIRSSGATPAEAPPVWAEGRNFREAVEEFEGSLIQQALARANGVQSVAAKLLGISRRILKYKMDKYGLA